MKTQKPATGIKRSAKTVSELKHEVENARKRRTELLEEFHELRLKYENKEISQEEFDSQSRIISDKIWRT